VHISSRLNRFSAIWFGISLIPRVALQRKHRAPCLQSKYPVALYAFMSHSISNTVSDLWRSREPDSCIHTLPNCRTPTHRRNAPTHRRSHPNALQRPRHRRHWRRPRHGPQHLALTKAVAKEAAGDGIRVNSIGPVSRKSPSSCLCSPI
jgi:hypothetical protein